MIEDVAACLSRLERLTGEYVVSMEICQHGQVARLAGEICECLVELYEGELEEANEACGLELELIDLVCARLRGQAELVLAYNDVLDFVSIQDSLCLQALLGALGRFNGDLSGAAGPSEVAHLAEVLRKSVYLLGCIGALNSAPDACTSLGSNGRPAGNREGLLLEKGRPLVDRIEHSGFPIFLINTDAHLVSRAPAAAAAATGSGSPSPLLLLLLDRLHKSPRLDTDWFRQFAARALVQRYPVDRVPVLVALWQVARRANHRALHRLIGQLMQQVAHEEANSGAEEELLQLSQAGSVWLSWRRRRCTPPPASGGQLPGAGSPNSSDPSSGSDEGSSECDLSDASSNPSTSSSSSGGSSAACEQEEKPAAHLRRIIDRELMRASRCAICGRAPAGAHLELAGCPRCGFQATRYRCALSHRPLGLASLRELARAIHNTHGFALISANEWARQVLGARRQALAASASSKGARFSAGARPPVGERLALGETFERLTVVRHRLREPGRLNGGSNSSSSSSASSAASAAEEDFEPAAAGANRPASPRAPTEHLAAALGQVRSLAAAWFRRRRRRRRRRNKLAARKSQQVSLSVRLLNFGAGTRRTLQALFAGDLLLVELGAPEVELAEPVLATEPLPPGSLWICSSRSARSRLPVGCMRLFSARALISRGHLASRGVLCPLCGRHPLEPVRALAETL